MSSRDSQSSVLTTDSQGNMVRRGSLRSKGGLFGGWKTKHAVLEDNQFAVFKDEKQKKCEVQITLTDTTQVTAKPAKNPKKSPYIEISQPNEKKKKATSLVFKTKDEAEQAAWIASFKEALDKDKVEIRVFGVPLQKMKANPNSFDAERQIPIIAFKCVEFLKSGERLKEEGIFRLAGNFERINELKELFNAGKNPNFDDNEDVNVVTALLKQFLGSLPEPLLLTKNYEKLLASSRESEKQLLQTLSTCIQTLPTENATLLRYLCQFLLVVAEKSKQNKMDVKNLATVFGPNILKGSHNDPMKLMAESDLVSRTVECLISHMGEIFAQEEAPSSSQNAEAPSEPEDPKE